MLSFKKNLILVYLLLGMHFLATSCSSSNENEAIFTETATDPTATKNKNPGHYLAVKEDFELSELKFLKEPAIKGVIKRYFWKDLETEKGVYDLSKIENDLAFLNNLNKQLIVFITDKSFFGASVLPEYLKNYEITNEKITVPKRWESFVIYRTILLGNSITEKFDNRLNFEGVALQESALSLPAAILETNGYTPEKYRDALIETINGIEKKAKQSQVFWYMNFLPGNNDYLAEIVNNLTSKNIVLSGPDILPYRLGLKDITYPLYEKFKDQFYLGCSVQWDSYKHHKNDTTFLARDSAPIHEEGYIELKEIFAFGRDRLFLNYVFWSYFENPPVEDAFDTEDAVEVIRKNPEFNPKNNSF